MSGEAWGDEGNVPEHGRDTAAFQELCEIKDRLHKWTCDFKSELNPDEKEKTDDALGLIDDAIELLDVPL